MTSVEKFTIGISGSGDVNSLTSELTSALAQALGDEHVGVSKDPVTASILALGGGVGIAAILNAVSRLLEGFAKIETAKKNTVTYVDQQRGLQVTITSSASNATLQTAIEGSKPMASDAERSTR